MHLSSPANIILVYQDLRIDRNDMRVIAKRIVTKAPQINVHFVLPLDTFAVLPPHVWQLPTITVSFGQTGIFVPLRGPLFVNKAISKLDQAVHLARADVNTPRTAIFRFGMQLDVKE